MDILHGEQVASFDKPIYFDVNMLHFQAFWKGARQKKVYKERLNYLADNTDAATKVNNSCTLYYS